MSGKVVYVVMNMKLTYDEPFDSIWDNLEDAQKRLKDRKAQPMSRGWYDVVEVDLNRVVANDTGWLLRNPKE